MSVVGSAKPIGTRSARISVGGIRTRERVYLVRTDSSSDGSAIVQLAPGLPQIGDVYGEIDTGMVCVDLLPENVPGSHLVWHVTVIYSTEYDSITQILSEPPEVDFPSEPGEEPIIGQEKSSVSYPPADQISNDNPFQYATVDNKTGKGIINSAGGLYDPPATRRISVPLFIFVRNENSFSLAKKVQYENSVNATAWNGLTSRQAICRNINATAMYFQPPTITQQRILYWKIRYEFALKYETWDLILPDAGWFYLDYTSGSARRKPFKTPDGTPMIGLLDHSSQSQPGKQLAAGSDMQYNRWRRFRENNFGALNINLDLSLGSLITTGRGFRSIVDPSKTPVQVA